MHSCSSGSAPCLCTREEAAKNFSFPHFCDWNPLGSRACWGSRISDVTTKLPISKSISSPLLSAGEKQTPDFSQRISLGEGDSSVLCCSNEDQEAPSQESSHLPPMEKSCCPSSRLLLSVLGAEAKHFAYPGPLFFHQQNETSNKGEKTQLTFKILPTKKIPIIFLN